MKKLPMLPKKVFITWEDGGSDESVFLSAVLNINTVVEVGETKIVGVYELVDTKTAVNKTELV